MKDLRQTFGGLGNRLFQLAYIYKQARTGAIPDIYLQDESFFEPYGNELRSILKEGLNPIDMVSVHVRRGDYLNNPFYVNLQETDYYEEALAQFPGEKFLIFCADRQLGSDDTSDMEWCQERFKGKDFSFYQGKDEIEDFNQMASCKAHIVANSSFSWWAAYVSGNKTVAPSKWFAMEGVAKSPSLPASWIVI